MFVNYIQYVLVLPLYPRVFVAIYPNMLIHVFIYKCKLLLVCLFLAALPNRDVLRKKMVLEMILMAYREAGGEVTLLAQGECVAN